MLTTEKFYSLMENLKSTFSKPELHEDLDHTFSLTTVFYEENEACFKITCSPITSSNFEICTFVWNSIMHVARDMFQEGMRSEDKYIVSTSGFSDACERTIARYKKELDENQMIMQITNIFSES